MTTGAAAVEEVFGAAFPGGATGVLFSALAALVVPHVVGHLERSAAASRVARDPDRASLAVATPRTYRVGSDGQAYAEPYEPAYVGPSQGASDAAHVAAAAVGAVLAAQSKLAGPVVYLVIGGALGFAAAHLTRAARGARPA